MRTSLPHLVLATTILALVGCTTPTQKNSWRQGTTTIKITGTPGTRVTGFYLQDGRQHEFSSALPFTLTEIGLEKVEIRKVNVEDSIVADVRYESPGRQLSVADALAGSGIPGIRIHLKNSFLVEHLKK